MSSVNDTCHLGMDYWRMSDNAEYVTYGVLPVFVLVLGVPGHLLALLAFYKQSQNQKAYGFQVFCALSDLLEMFSLVTLVNIFYWSAIAGPGVTWYRVSYPLMWYAAHVSAPLIHMVLTNSHLGSLFMSMDRVAALSMPIRYRNWNHRRNQMIAFVFCIVIGVSSSIFDCYRYVLHQNVDGTYSALIDLEYANGLTARVMANFRNTIRLLCIVLLIGSNIAMIYYYHGRFDKIQAGATTAEKIEKRKEQKVLLILTLTQSVLTSIRALGHVALSIVIYGVPQYNQCGQVKLVIAIASAFVEITAIANFYIWFLVSKQFRANVRQALCSRFAQCGSADAQNTNVVQLISAAP